MSARAPLPGQAAWAARLALLGLAGGLACSHVRLDDGGSLAEGLTRSEAASVAAGIAALLARELPVGAIALDPAPAGSALPAALEQALASGGWRIVRGEAAGSEVHHLRFRAGPDFGGLLVRLSLDWRIEATRLYRREPEGLVAQAPWGVGRWE